MSPSTDTQSKKLAMRGCTRDVCSTDIRWLEVSVSDPLNPGVLLWPLYTVDRPTKTPKQPWYLREKLNYLDIAFLLSVTRVRNSQHRAGLSINQ
jgi:hypothetical protein